MDLKLRSPFTSFAKKLFRSGSCRIESTGISGRDLSADSADSRYTAGQFPSHYSAPSTHHEIPDASLNGDDYKIAALQDLRRLAQLGANLADAHSCLIFLPLQIYYELLGDGRMRSDGGLSIGQNSPNRTADSLHPRDTMVLAAYHSLGGQVIDQAALPEGSGIVSWVAKHSKIIHVSPFERDSRTLGFYRSDQQLKSFIGVPVNFSHVSAAEPLPCGTLSQGAAQQLENAKSYAASCASMREMDHFDDSSAARASRPALCGVLACDSKKSFAFSKLQGKLLEQLACEVSNVVMLHLRPSADRGSEVDWGIFLRRAAEFSEAVGPQSAEILRIGVLNSNAVEATRGTSEYIKISNQFLRLVQQAIPEQYPCTRLINGDIIIVVDSMMSSFVENKISSLCRHPKLAGCSLSVAFFKASARKRGAVFKVGSPRAITDLVSETAKARLEHETRLRSNSSVRMSSEIRPALGGNLVRLDREIGYGNR